MLRNELVTVMVPMLVQEEMTNNETETLEYKLLMTHQTASTMVAHHAWLMGMSNFYNTRVEIGSLMITSKFWN